MEIKFKQYGASIPFTKKAIEGTVFKLISEGLKRVTICVMHSIIYNFEGHEYRKYKRGKSRCSRCGVKIG